jgi:hypothetical protein
LARCLPAPRQEFVELVDLGAPGAVLGQRRPVVVFFSRPATFSRKRCY